MSDIPTATAGNEPPVPSADVRDEAEPVWDSVTGFAEQLTATFLRTGQGDAAVATRAALAAWHDDYLRARGR